LEDNLETPILVLGIAFFAVAAYGDVKTYRIPNALVIAVAILGVFRLVTIGDLTTALYTLGASVLVFIVAFLLFWRGLVGGGDAKLITAAASLIGYHDLLSFLLAMSICGGVVSLAVLITYWFKTKRSILGSLVSLALTIYHPGNQALAIYHPGSEDQPPPKAKLAVPYGVAIATAGGVTLLFQSSLSISFVG
jgi:Flp pilus assembly protein protease CpaA